MVASLQLSNDAVCDIIEILQRRWIDGRFICMAHMTFPGNRVDYFDIYCYVMVEKSYLSLGRYC